MLQKEREKATKKQGQKSEEKKIKLKVMQKKRALMRRKGEIKERRMKSGQFLQWMSFGASSNSLQHEQWPI